MLEKHCLSPDAMLSDKINQILDTGSFIFHQYLKIRLECKEET